MRDMQKVLDLWGAWAASDACNVDYSPIAAGFKGLLPETDKTRMMCSDNDGLIIEGCMSRLHRRRPYDYFLLIGHYVYGISKRKMAKSRKKSESLIRVEMQLAEGFIEGCLAMLNMPLEMDSVVEMQNSQKSASALRTF